MTTGDRPPTTDHRPPATDHAEQHGRLETDVACLKTGLRDADQDAKHNGQSEPQNQVHLLLECALFTKQQFLELFGPHQAARHSRRHAQLDQQIYKH